MYSTQYRIVCSCPSNFRSLGYIRATACFLNLSAPLFLGLPHQTKVQPKLSTEGVPRTLLYKWGDLRSIYQNHSRSNRLDLN